MSTVEEAHEIVQRLTGQYGYLDDAMMDHIAQWNPEYRRRIDENWLAMESTAAHSIKTLAKQIYGSDARFVFELLQNADDNAFFLARMSCLSPSILFKVYPDRIIVECNEDGFTENDLAAICAVGQSTKVASHGYIGAKGIGFKSVFIAAWRVHIQSRNYSFEFRHRKNDPGLGMVRPIWVETGERLDRPLTRMTLYLHDEGDPDELRHLKRVIFKQLDDLQHTSLLFLRKLERIGVEFYDEQGNLQRSKAFRKHTVGNHRVSLNTVFSENGRVTNQDRIFHIARKTATGLARSDNRELPNTDEARRISASAEVILGFPLTSESKPLVTEKQDIFAFLPVRESDFKFLIHTDFDTSASRQDIVTTSRRNVDLLDGIADTFIQAILQFCEHQTLCYDWPMFLPRPGQGSNPFWSSLNRKIEERVKTTPLFRSRRRGDLRLISDVSLLTIDVKYGNEEPIFDDPEEDPFLSPKYAPSIRTALTDYGLSWVSAQKIVALLELDLRKSDSRMHGNTMSDEWHSTVAKLFCVFFDKGWSVARRLGSLALLPLRDGTWTSTQSGPVYFPTTKGITIPQRVGIRVLDASATANPSRSTLFHHLGASEASVKDVRSSILNIFKPNRLGELNLNILKGYLHYLYVTHDPDVHSRRLETAVLTDSGTLARPNSEDIYLPGMDHPYGPEALLSPNGEAPGLPVTFLNPKFKEEPPDKPTPQHPTWVSWLLDYIGVRERLRLVSRQGDLSEAFLYVLQSRPKKFLGLFEHLWRHEGSQVRNNRELKDRIRDLSANGICSVQGVHLKDAWIPVRSLVSTVSRHMEDPGLFPFLKFEGGDTGEHFGTKWSFLAQHFDLGKDDGVQFLLEILRCIEDSSTLSVRQCQMVWDLYVALYAKVTSSEDPDAERLRISDFFSRQDGILIPDETEPSWRDLNDCLWLAPPGMVSVCSLKSLYSKWLGGAQMNIIEGFLCEVVGVRNATLVEIFFEIKKLQQCGIEDFEHTRGLYEFLSKLNASTGLLRHTFEESPLIFADKSGTWGWYTVSECLWSSTTAIRGKVTLDQQYEELREFFVDRLGVKSLTLQMAYDELLQEGSQQGGIDEVKSVMLSFNDLLQEDEEALLDPRPISKANVFPVKCPDGTRRLVSADTEFAIGDRDYLRNRFQDNIRLLDFDLEDVRRLKPFFQWARLENRYLSNCVKEFTFVADGAKNPITSQNRDLSLKAYHILRIAATFGSPRYQTDPAGLYETLRNMKVVETNGISSILKVSQDGRSFEVEESTASEHISETSSELAVYVPKRKKAQEVCFITVLPRKLAEWIMRNPVTLISINVEAEMVNALASVFACPRSVLDGILDHQGIINVPLSNEDRDDTDNDESEDESDSVVDTGSSSTDGQMTPTHSSIYESDSQLPVEAHSGPVNNDTDTETLVETVVRQSHMSYRSSQERRQVPAQVSLSPGTPRLSHPASNPASQHIPRSPPSFSPSPSPSYPTRQPAEDSRYCALLGRVITSARQAAFPSQGTFDMSNLRDALLDGLDEDAFESFDGLDVVSRFRSANQLERDKRVGAAGELYVFELLSKLNLPSWSRGNWQSTIRTYTKIHPEYSDLEAWSRRETADLVYDDNEGHFTNTLIGCGYLDSDEWHGARPRYYIEVKTTTWPCNTQFYMSGNQYQLMQRIHNSDDRSEVYMILRVFNLNTDRIGMCVYLDPEQLRQDRQLVFTGQTWSVVPGDGTQTGD